jgi:uncharacterized damage-inducible protein DinB
MDKDTISLLARYNQKANEKMEYIVSSLGEKEWNHPFPGYFTSLRAVASHLFISSHTWVRRLRTLRDFALAKDSYFEKIYPYEAVLFPHPREFTGAMNELSEKITAFAGELTEADLGLTLKYTDSEGEKFERNYGNCWIHFLNHQTHHRGMISQCLEILGKENDYNSLLPAIEGQR